MDTKIEVSKKYLVQGEAELWGTFEPIVTMEGEIVTIIEITKDYLRVGYGSAYGGFFATGYIRPDTELLPCL